MHSDSTVRSFVDSIALVKPEERTRRTTTGLWHAIRAEVSERASCLGCRCSTAGAMQERPSSAHTRINTGRLRPGKMTSQENEEESKIESKRKVRNRKGRELKKMTEPRSLVSR
jgi:hypothetical protein